MKKGDSKTESGQNIDTDTLLEDGGLIKVSSRKELDALIERVNKTYFYVIIGMHGYVAYEYYDRLFHRQVIHYIAPHTFHELCGPTMVLRTNIKKSKPAPLSKIWMKHPKWRHYKGVVFSPDQPVPNGTFNLWRGFRTNVRGGDCKPFLNFVFEVICNRNTDHYNYVLAWMADAVQNLSASKKPGVALVLRGERGTGKGFFTTHFGFLFGQHFVHVTNPDHLIGKFNRHLQYCLLLFADEMAGTKKGMGVLQGLITEPTILIEIKGKDAFPALNYMRIILASNFDWVVPAGPNERRWAVFDVSDCHKQDTAYFTKLHASMEDGGWEALLHYLLKYDYSKINLRKVPETSALGDQLVSTMDGIDSYWYSLLQKGSYPRPAIVAVEGKWGSALMVKDKIYQDYLDTAKGEGKIGRSSTAFWSRVRKLCPSLKEDRPAATEYKRSFEVPPLEEARNLFDKLYGHKFIWEEEIR
jgi:hypothetical protein